MVAIRGPNNDSRLPTVADVFRKLSIAAIVWPSIPAEAIRKLSEAFGRPSTVAEAVRMLSLVTEGRPSITTEAVRTLSVVTVCRPSIPAEAIRGCWSIVHCSGSSSNTVFSH